MGYSPAVTAVEMILKNDPSELVRACAAETLGDLGDPSVVETLKFAFNDPDEAVQAYAINSFGLLASPSECSILVGYLHPGLSEGTRAEILGAQWRLGLSEAGTHFLELMKVTTPDSAINVVNVLEDLVDRKNPDGMPDNVPRFRQALQEMDLSQYGSVQGLMDKLDALNDRH